MAWHPGDPPPTRPERTDGDYVRKLERYVDDIEAMLFWLTGEFARFPDQIAASAAAYQAAALDAKHGIPTEVVVAPHADGYTAKVRKKRR